MITPAHRSPFEVLMTLAFGLYALAGIFAFEKVATTVLRGFPPPWGRVFLMLAFVTCVVVLVGVATAHTANGVLIERGGLVGLAGVCAAYSIWAFGNTGIRALGFGLLLGALAVSSAWRAVQITRALRVAKGAQRQEA